MELLFTTLVCVILISLIILALLGFGWLFMIMIANIISFYKEWKNPPKKDKYY